MELLKKYFNELDIPYNNDQIEMFRNYYELLTEWNNRMNLTSITQSDEVIVKHFVDSALICCFMKFEDKSRLIDVGTGAGFPGLPIKILNPDCNVILLDSLNKRIKFLNEVIDTLGLKNIEAIHGRAEDVSREKTYRGKFDYAVSRAVANLSTLSEYCIPFIKEGGKFISYKSDKSNEEINNSATALQCLNSEITSIKEITIPDTDIKRRLIVITNKKSVNKKYPRKAGIPAKEPL